MDISSTYDNLQIYFILQIIWKRTEEMKKAIDM